MDFEEPPYVVVAGEDILLHLNEKILIDVIGKFEPPFLVLSAIGSPGSGKSFLFNYILRYLKANGERNWIGRSDTILDGFPWDQGDEHDEDDERKGIRIYHEVITISAENDNRLQLILLDIDYFINPESSNTTKMYAAFESFCLSVSNAVIFVDSNIKMQMHLEVNAYLDEILAILKSFDLYGVKYIVYEKQDSQTEAESSRNSVPVSVKRFNLKPIKPLTYRYSAQAPSFKGEHRYISSLKDFKSLLINCFPVNELLQLLSYPDKICQSVEEVQMKFRDALSELNGLITEVKIGHVSEDVHIVTNTDSQHLQEETNETSVAIDSEPNSSIFQKTESTRRPDQSIQDLFQNYSSKLDEALKMSTYLLERFNKRKLLRETELANKNEIRLQETVEAVLQKFKNSLELNPVSEIDRCNAIGKAMEEFQDTLDLSINADIVKTKKLELKTKLTAALESFMEEPERQEIVNVHHICTEQQDNLVAEYKTKMKPLLQNCSDPESIHYKYVEYIRRTISTPNETYYKVIEARFRTELENLLQEISNEASALSPKNLPSIPNSGNLTKIEMSETQIKVSNILSPPRSKYSDLIEFLKTLEFENKDEFTFNYILSNIEDFGCRENSQTGHITESKNIPISYDPQSKRDGFKHESEQNPWELAQSLSDEYTAQMSQTVSEIGDSGISWADLEAKHEKLRIVVTSKFRPGENYPFLECRRAEQELYQSIEQSYMNIKEVLETGHRVQSSSKESDLNWRKVIVTNNEPRISNQLVIKQYLPDSNADQKITTNAADRYSNETMDSLVANYTHELKARISEKGYLIKVSDLERLHISLKDSAFSNFGPLLVDGFNEISEFKQRFYTLIDEVYEKVINEVEETRITMERELDSLISDAVINYEERLKTVPLIWILNKISRNLTWKLEAKPIADEVLHNFLKKAELYKEDIVKAHEHHLKILLKQAFDKYVSNQMSIDYEKQDAAFEFKKYELVKDYNDQMTKCLPGAADPLDIHDKYVNAKILSLEFARPVHKEQLKQTYQKAYAKIQEELLPEPIKCDTGINSRFTAKPAQQTFDFPKSFYNDPIPVASPLNDPIQSDMSTSSASAPSVGKVKHGNINFSCLAKAEESKSSETGMLKHRKTKNKFLQIVNVCLNSYEEQMRIYFDENSPEAILHAKHKFCTESAIKLFQNSTAEDIRTEEFQSILREKIVFSFSQSMLLWRTDQKMNKSKQPESAVPSKRSEAPGYLPKHRLSCFIAEPVVVRDDPLTLTDHIPNARQSQLSRASSLAEIPHSKVASSFHGSPRRFLGVSCGSRISNQKRTIGIHMGRSKLRCSSYWNSKYYNIPLEETSNSMPSYIGINTEGNLVLGSEAKRVFKSDNSRSFKLIDIQIGGEHTLGSNKDATSINFEVAVAVYLKYICHVSSEYLNSEIDQVVVTVPSLSDHTYRRSIADAAQLAEIHNIHLVSECSSAISRYIQKQEPTIGTTKSVMVAYQGKNNNLEASCFTVNQESTVQLSVSGKHGAKSARSATPFSHLLPHRNPTHTGIFSNALEGTQIDQLDAMLVVMDHPRAEVDKLSSRKRYNEDIDLLTGVVEGASYYAHCLASGNSKFLQECLPYDLQYEFKGKTHVAFNKFTRFPAESKLRFYPNENEVRIELYAYFSKKFFYHTETVSVSTLQSGRVDTVEVLLELDLQGFLSISASLIESTSGSRKSVSINTLFTNNMDSKKIKKCKNTVDVFFGYLKNTSTV